MIDQKYWIANFKKVGLVHAKQIIDQYRDGTLKPPTEFSLSDFLELLESSLWECKLLAGEGNNRKIAKHNKASGYKD